ncbi:hypothetical protein Dimus_031728, partial [Dionaea muscipula]
MSFILLPGCSGFTNTNYTRLSELYSKDQEVVKRATVKKGAQVAKIPNPRAATAAENIKGEQRVDLGLPTAIDPGAERKAAVKLRTEESEAAAIGGVARKRVDLIIVNIDEASGDDELAVAEYAEDIYKFYKLTE